MAVLVPAQISAALKPPFRNSITMMIWVKVIAITIRDYPEDY